MPASSGWIGFAGCRHSPLDGDWTAPLTANWCCAARPFAPAALRPGHGPGGLLEQFRLGALDRRPAGLDDRDPGRADRCGEEAAQSAARETPEETGLDVAEAAAVGDFATARGGFNEWVSLFCGSGRRPRRRQPARPGVGAEDIRILPMPASGGAGAAGGRPDPETRSR